MKNTLMKPSDEIRIIAPSFSWRSSRDKAYGRSVKRLEDLGYKVTLGKSVKKYGRLGTATIQQRLTDFHDAYADQNVRAVLCLNGGWSANELLPGIDWQLLRDNPKPLIGFSDITVLHNAIWAKTGQIGYLGPNLGSFGWATASHWRYTLDNLQQVLTSDKPLQLAKSQGWQSGKVTYKTTPPWKVLQEGSAQGMLLGGNLGTYYLLQGTEYAPKFDQDIILAIEDDAEAGSATAREFDRRLESLMQQPKARESVKGVLIGRFEKDSKVTLPDIRDIVQRKFAANIPVVADVDFGHTKPLLTLPIGGTVSVQATLGKFPNITLVDY